MKKENAITLVALIVTIIILVILAGITINALTGENGLFTRAKKADKAYENAQELEKNQIGKFIDEVDYYGNLNDKVDYNRIIRDIKFNINYIMPKFTSNSTNINGEGTYNISASSTYDSPRQPYKVSDNSIAEVDGCWHSSNYLPQTVNFSFDEKIKIKKLTIQNRYGGCYQHEFEIQISDDGNSWTKFKILSVKMVRQEV